MDNQHLVLIEMPVRWNFGDGQEGLRTHRKGGSGLAGIDLEDNFARRRRAQLEDFALSRLENLVE